MGLNRSSVARDASTQQAHYLRRTLSIADMAKTVTIGTIPAGATILRAASGAQVNVAFNSATTTTLNIGTTASAALYGSALDVKTGIAFVPLDEVVTMAVSADTTITAALAETGTAATAGSVQVIIAYLPAS